jgi:hypothetical protein
MNIVSYNPSLAPRVRWREIEQRYVAASQKWKCVGCHKLLPAAFDIDHRIPYQLGGRDAYDNLQALCPLCHALKTRMEQKVIQNIQDYWVHHPHALICFLCLANVSRFFVDEHAKSCQPAVHANWRTMHT